MIWGYGGQYGYTNILHLSKINKHKEAIAQYSFYKKKPMYKVMMCTAYDQVRSIYRAEWIHWTPKMKYVGLMLKNSILKGVMALTPLDKVKEYSIF